MDKKGLLIILFPNKKPLKYAKLSFIATNNNGNKNQNNPLNVLYMVIFIGIINNDNDKTVNDNIRNCVDKYFILKHNTVITNAKAYNHKHIY
mmetsp:Transcript_4872/g.6311  ORF Transcript_4872/g.6311 Transcript_4872/m.6311 type:complete len:92 (+) Transcript_4872:930-1205(+)